MQPTLYPLLGEEANTGRGGESQEGDGGRVAESCSTQGLIKSPTAYMTNTHDLLVCVFQCNSYIFKGPDPSASEI